MDGDTMRRLWFRFVFGALGGTLLLFVILPVGAVVVGGSGHVRSALAAADGEYATAILRSFWLGGLTALVALALGVPLGYLLARARFRGRGAIEALMDLPLAVPHAVAGIALLGVFGRGGVLGGAYESVTGGAFIGSHVAIVLAMLFVSVPYAVSSARVAFGAVDERLERVARVLGAPESAVFSRISLPLAWRGVVAGAVLVWARAMSEFGAVVMVAYHPMTGSVAVWDAFTSRGPALSSGLAALLLIASLTTFATLRLSLAPRRP